METQKAPQYCPKKSDHQGAGENRRSLSPIKTAEEQKITVVSGIAYVKDDRGTLYTMESLLGKGGFAKVYKLTGQTNGVHQTVAGKIISKKRISKPHNKDRVANEVDIHRHMKHENVVQFIRFFEDTEHVFIILEYCGSKTLSGILKARKRLTEPEVRYYLKQVVAGCQHIHNQKIVHRDLKLSNLFVNDHMTVKIGDFGLSTFIDNTDDKKQSICGTPNYISPEVILKAGHSYPVDVWAIGCVIYALLAGRPPFETQCLKDTYKLIAKSRYPELKSASCHARDLIYRCLRVDPKIRPTLLSILSDPFLGQGYIPSSLPTSAMLVTPVFKTQQNNEKSGTDEIKEIESPPEVDTIQYLLETISNQEICAEGGKDLNDPLVRVFTCRRLLEAMRAACDTLKGKQEKTNPAPVRGDDLLWITKWVDYSHKYGFGFQLSNHVYGASFKDGFSISVNSDTTCVGLQDTDGTTLECLSKDINGHSNYMPKYQTMMYFVKYMSDTLIKGGDLEHADTNIPLNDIFMLRWIRTKQSIAMCLSTGTVQVNFFSDHTKLVVAHTPYIGIQLMFINSKRQSHVFTLEEIVNHGCTTDIKQRLQYAMLQLELMLSINTSSP